MITFNNYNLTVNNQWLLPLYNRHNLPAYTIRIRTNGYSPDWFVKAGATWVAVAGETNVYDITYNDTNWNALFTKHLITRNEYIVEVIDANTKGVTTMRYLFAGCVNLESVALFDTSDVTDMAGMFGTSGQYGALGKLKRVPFFDTHNVTNMSSMFSGCTALETVPLFDTHNVTSMTSMFNNESNYPTHSHSLRYVPNFDTSNVTDMSGMFNYCVKLESIPLFDTHKVTTMREMLYNCSSLQSIPAFDTSNVTDMGYFFGHFVVNTTVEELPLFNTHNVTDMEGAFINCSALKHIPLFDTSNVTNMRVMFSCCVNVESGALALYQQASTQTNPPTRHNNTFTYCGSDTVTGAAELAQIPDDWK